MARTTHALGSSVKGRIGGLTLYVREGKQIVYERKQRLRREHEDRSYMPNEIMRHAWEWKAQLKEVGIATTLDMMMKWLYAIRDAAATGTSIVLANEVDGAFSPNRLLFKDGNLCYAHGGDYVARQTTPWGSWPYWLTDYPTNRYPADCFFVAPRAGEVLNVDLAIGRRTNADLSGLRIANAPTQVPNARLAYASIAQGIVYVRWRGGLAFPSPFYIYRVVGWRALLSTWGGVRVYPYMVIGADGRLLHLAVLVQ